MPTVAFAGQPFFRSAWPRCARGRLNMDVPISLAVLLAAGHEPLSRRSTGGEHAYFDAAVTLLFFLLVGRYLDHRMRDAARSAAAESDRAGRRAAPCVLGADGAQRTRRRSTRSGAGDAAAGRRRRADAGRRHRRRRHERASTVRC